MNTDSPKTLLGSVSIAPEAIEEVKKNIHNIADFSSTVKTHSSQNTTNLLDIILLGAISLEASDIHIEPQKENARLRIRLDGVLQDAAIFDQSTYHNLLSRLKVLSKLKLNITDKPQDGRFTVEIEK